MTIKIIPNGSGKFRPQIHLQFCDKAGQSPVIWICKLYPTPVAAEGVAKMMRRQFAAKEEAQPGYLVSLAKKNLKGLEPWKLQKGIDDALEFNAQFRERVKAQKRRPQLEAQAAQRRAEVMRQQSALLQRHPSGLLIQRRSEGGWVESIRSNPF